MTKTYQKICQKQSARQNAKKKCQKICQIELNRMPKECQKICQIEFEKVWQIECQTIYSNRENIMMGLTFIDIYSLFMCCFCVFCQMSFYLCQVQKELQPRHRLLSNHRLICRAKSWLGTNIRAIGPHLSFLSRALEVCTCHIQERTFELSWLSSILLDLVDVTGVVNYPILVNEFEQ